MHCNYKFSFKKNDSIQGFHTYFSSQRYANARAKRKGVFAKMFVNK